MKKFLKRKENNEKKKIKKEKRKEPCNRERQDFSNREQCKIGTHMSIARDWVLQDMDV